MVPRCFEDFHLKEKLENYGLGPVSEQQILAEVKEVVSLIIKSPETTWNFCVRANT